MKIQIQNNNYCESYKVYKKKLGAIEIGVACGFQNNFIVVTHMYRKEAFLLRISAIK